jgi:AbiV family abortive infection protein
VVRVRDEDHTSEGGTRRAGVHCPTMKIPRDRLRDGIDRCLDTSLARLGEAQTLANAGSLMMASVVFSFGVEEFGKAVLLREAWEAGDAAPDIEKKRHEKKLEAAGRHIPTEHLTLRPGHFSSHHWAPGFFPSGYWGEWVSEFASRLAGLYVDWNAKGQAWASAPEPPHPDVIRRCIAGVRGIVEVKQKEWL